MRGMRDWTNVKDVSILATAAPPIVFLTLFASQQSNEASKQKWQVAQERKQKFEKRVTSSDLKFASNRQNYFYYVMMIRRPVAERAHE